MVDSLLVTPENAACVTKMANDMQSKLKTFPFVGVAPDDREDEVPLRSCSTRTCSCARAPSLRPAGEGARRSDEETTRMTGPAAAPPLLRITEMTKRFPGTLALDGVDLVVERGTIHGLLGENGAGKSTLLKILAGDYRPSSGRIEIEGEEVEVSTPRRAHELGIGIVYQELSLLANLSVAHNISLGNEPTNALADRRAAPARDRPRGARAHGRALDRPGPEGRGRSRSRSASSSRSRRC